jgi:hypothetical protein
MTNSDPHRKPNLDWKALPQDEQDAGHHLAQAFQGLEDFTISFMAAAELFEVNLYDSLFQPDGAYKKRALSWMWVACRDGAMSIYHFGKALEGIMSYLGQCPTVLEMTDRKLVRVARKRLRELFPNFEAVRHAVAHAGELMNDPETKRRHAVKADNLKLLEGLSVQSDSLNIAQVNIVQVLSGRKFTNTFEGKVQSYEISRETLDALIDVKRIFYSAFREAEAELARRADSPNPKGSS